MGVKSDRLRLVNERTLTTGETEPSTTYWSDWYRPETVVNIEITLQCDVCTCSFGLKCWSFSSHPHVHPIHTPPPIDRFPTLNRLTFVHNSPLGDYLKKRKEGKYLTRSVLKTTTGRTDTSTGTFQWTRHRRSQGHSLICLFST